MGLSHKSHFNIISGRQQWTRLRKEVTGDLKKTEDACSKRTPTLGVVAEKQKPIFMLNQAHQRLILYFEYHETEAQGNLAYHHL
jgi:hypothetical protein